MATPKSYINEFFAEDIQTDDAGNHVKVHHGMGRSFPTVAVWRSPGDVMYTPLRVMAVTGNMLKVYLPQGAIVEGGSIRVRVVA